MPTETPVMEAVPAQVEEGLDKSQYTLVKLQPKRTFGVELEFTRTTSRERLQETISSVGEAAVVRDWGHSVDNREWICKTDSSCGYEVASRVLGSTRSVRKTLRDLVVLEKVVEALRDSGRHKVDTSCGLHVHIWIGDFNDRQIQSLLSYWIKLEYFLINLMPEARRRNRYCPMTSSKFEPSVSYTKQQLISMGTWQRGSLNLNRYNEQKTIEIRLAEGSVDPNMVKNWTRFLLHFIERVKVVAPPEDVNWLTLEQSLNFLDFLNFPEEGKFRILSPALTETRTWLLQRANTYASYRDADSVRARTAELLANLS